MKNRLEQGIPAFLALLAIGFSEFALSCTSNGHVCYRTVLDSAFLDVINPLYFFSLYFLPLAIILTFIPQTFFKSWLKLATWLLPLLVIYVALTSNTPTAPVDFYPFYRDDAARLAAEVFDLVSIILIGWKYFRQRRQYV